MSRLLGGISLPQFAGVTTALAEGFELAAVLEQEQIAPATWPDAARAWTEAIVEAPDLQMELVKERRVAEDCLERSIAPLDADPAAWCGLLGALATADEPAKIVEPLGLSMADVARLGRKWKKKMEGDPELAKRVVEIAPTAKPPARVEAAPRALKPFPWTPSRPASDASRASDARSDAEPRRSLGITRPFDAPPPRRERASFQIGEDGHTAPTATISPPVAAVVPGAPIVPAARVPPGAPIVPAARVPPAAPMVPAARVAAPAAAPPVPAAPVGVVAPGPVAVSLAAPPGQATAWAPSDAGTQPATPFEALEPGAHGLTLMRYVELQVRLQEPGAHRGEVLAAFGVDEARKEAVDAHYDRKFSREARWATEFGRLMAQAQKAALEERAAKKRPAGSGTSFAPLAAARAPDLNLEQYAWVTASLRRAPPEALAEVLARFRLTEATRRELDATWRARAAADPALEAALGAAIDRLMRGTPQADARPSPGPSPPRQAGGAPAKLAGTALAPDGPPAPSTPFVRGPGRPSRS